MLELDRGVGWNVHFYGQTGSFHTDNSTHGSMWGTHFWSAFSGIGR
jgi:hypothetical protein